MHFPLVSVALATLATTVSAANIQVQVGASSQLAFSPSSVNASVGDTNHTVTQSTFAAPCQPMSGGVDSGFQPVAANATNVPSFTVTTGHCEQGMVFAINPTANKSFAAFQSAAKASSADGTPASTSNTTTGTGSGSGSSTSSAPTSSSSSKSNGAVTAGARAGGLLAMVGFAAGILL
ncbi:hypothetical protein BJV77DRAFT_1014909 [Russula vinacea]|nr:hypothetical protein BJV77DRAFT_1014909 [Russula vinacea]